MGYWLVALAGCGSTCWLVSFDENCNITCYSWYQVSWLQYWWLIPNKETYSFVNEVMQTCSIILGLVWSPFLRKRPLILFMQYMNHEKSCLASFRNTEKIIIELWGVSNCGQCLSFRCRKLSKNIVKVRIAVHSFVVCSVCYNVFRRVL